MDASELHARRFNAKEVLTPMKGDKFSIPSRGRNSQNPLIRDRPERGEEQGNIPGKLDGVYSPTLLQDDSRRDDAVVYYGRIHLSSSRGT